MDETVIVIMLKDETTGFLEKELDSYTLAENSELIFSIYAEGRDEKTVTLRLTCGRTLEDWEYEAVYDYYDTTYYNTYFCLFIFTGFHPDLMRRMGHPKIQQAES